MHVVTITLGETFQKIGVLVGMKPLRQQFHEESHWWISFDATAEDITDFKRGRKTSVSSRTQQSLNSRTEQTALQGALQGLSLKKVGIWRNHQQDGTRNRGFRPAGGPAAVWESWTSVHCFISPWFPAQPLENRSSPIPKFPRCKMRGFTTSLLAISCNGKGTLWICLYDIQPRCQLKPLRAIVIQVCLVTDTKVLMLN